MHAFRNTWLLLVGLVPLAALAQDGSDLADLTVVAVQGGAPLAAGLEATDGTETFAALPGPLHVFGRLPGTSWSARAVLDCLVGDARVVLREGRNELRVPVLPVYDATLTFDVVDASGARVPDATVRWVSASHDCSPIDQQPAALAALVGAGTHELVVQAPGGASRQVRVRLARGEQREIRVVLDEVGA